MFFLLHHSRVKYFCSRIKSLMGEIRRPLEGGMTTDPLSAVEMARKRYFLGTMKVMGRQAFLNIVEVTRISDPLSRLKTLGNNALLNALSAVRVSRAWARATYNNVCFLREGISVDEIAKIYALTTIDANLCN